MTVSSTTNRITYNGDGITVAFACPYFLSNSDLKVYVDGVLKTLTTDYTVTGAGVESGGTVTFVSAPPSGTGNVIILRDVDQLQATDLPSNDPFPSKTVETALDKLTMLLQRCRDLLGRSFTLSDSDSSGASLTVPTPSALKFLRWNSAANAIENADIAAAGAVALPLSIGQGGTGQTTAAAARTAIGAFGATTADIASAATIDFSGQTGSISRITGTIATSAVTLNAGQMQVCIAVGAWPLTYHATNHPLPGSANYTCAAGDMVIYVKDNSGAITVRIAPKSGVPVSESAWTDYSATSTIVGWSSFTTKQIYYKDIGKTRFVYYKLDGTSNATTASFTVPSASSNTIDCGGPTRTDDNSVVNLGHFVLAANASVVNLYYSPAAASWTNSGTKRVIGQFTYQLP